MKNIKIGLAQTEEEIFAFEVSDEALEIAAGSTKEAQSRHGPVHCTCPLSGVKRT